MVTCTCLTIFKNMRLRVFVVFGALFFEMVPVYQDPLTRLIEESLILKDICSYYIKALVCISTWSETVKFSEH